MSGFLTRLGRWASPRARKARWIWQSMAGSQEERLAAEMQVGVDLMARLYPELVLDAEPAVHEWMGEVSERLIARLRQRSRRFEFHVLRDRSPNAFALPGGFVFVTRPLLDVLAHDSDQLAFVLGHELGHVVKEHALDRLVTQVTLETVRRWTRAGGLLQQPGAALLTRAYSQDQEEIADEFGVALARAAGFDGRGALRLMDWLKARDEPSFAALEYFRDHPSPERRRQVIARELRS